MSAAAGRLNDIVAASRSDEARARAVADQEASLGTKIGHLRGLTFLGAALSWGSALTGSEHETLAGALGALLIGAFLWLIRSHDRCLDRQARALRTALVHRHRWMRLVGEHAELPDTGDDLVPPDHPYASDLDLFGKGSLYQRVSTAHTQQGRRTLGLWLLDPAGRATTAARQEAVFELAPADAFRRDLEVEAMALERPRRGTPEPLVGADPEPLFRWLDQPAALTKGPLLSLVAWLIPLTTISGIALDWFDLAPPYLWAASFLAGLAVLSSSRDSTSRAFAAVSATQGAFLRYGRILEIVENYPAQGETLRELGKRLQGPEGAQKPSRLMRRFASIVGYFDLRHSGMAFPFIEALLLWSVHCTLALERFREEARPHVRDWFAILGEFEALSSLASVLADDPDAILPELGESSASLRATGLGHLLLTPGIRVKNDLPELAPSHCLLITGSNMSGKSTFLRTLGTNVVLAQAGGPVCAQTFTLPELRLGTSLRIADSLLAGTSHFYAEVKRLRDIVVQSERERTLFLLDEVLHGTNSRERQIGARAVIEDLLSRGALGLVTTHDEGLCQLSPGLEGKVTLHHFREHIEDGVMKFDFHLRPGPVVSGNALRLMRQAGLDVPLGTPE